MFTCLTSEHDQKHSNKDIQTKQKSLLIQCYTVAVQSKLEKLSNKLFYILEGCQTFSHHSTLACYLPIIKDRQTFNEHLIFKIFIDHGLLKLIRDWAIKSLKIKR